ncbi:MAG: GFA family protein [Stellaceae bacterium]
MELPLTGGCLCGKVRYEISEAPRQVYACHCRDCQRLTSSAFSMAMNVPDAAFHLTGAEPRALTSIAASGRAKVRLVCPECGCWICGNPDPRTGLRRVRAGTLDDTSWLRPTAHFWVRSKQPWVSLPEGAEIFETQPDA